LNLRWAPAAEQADGRKEADERENLLFQGIYYQQHPSYMDERSLDCKHFLKNTMTTPGEMGLERERL
jgi:hypothetical protein